LHYTQLLLSSYTLLSSADSSSSFSSLLFFFFFYCSGPHRDLHSFPTRRSSDLAFSSSTPAGNFSIWHIARMRYRTRNLHERTIGDRKSTRLNSSHLVISYAVFCLKKKKKKKKKTTTNKKTST